MVQWKWVTPDKSQAVHYISCTIRGSLFYFREYDPGNEVDVYYWTRTRKNAIGLLSEQNALKVIEELKSLRPKYDFLIEPHLHDFSSAEVSATN